MLLPPTCFLFVWSNTWFSCSVRRGQNFSDFLFGSCVASCPATSLEQSNVLDRSHVDSIFISHVIDCKKLNEFVIVCVC